MIAITFNKIILLKLISNKFMIKIVKNLIKISQITIIILNIFPKTAYKVLDQNI